MMPDTCIYWKKFFFLFCLGAKKSITVRIFDFWKHYIFEYNLINVIELSF